MRHTLHYLTLSLLMIVPAISQAAVIPSNRLPPAGTWESAGVPGGIPNRTKIVDLTGVVLTNGTDQSAAINKAISSASDGDVLLLPAGRITLSNRVLIQWKSITLRGRFSGGTWNTILDFNGGDILMRGIEDTISPHNIAGSVSAGATTIPVSGGTGDLSVGQAVRLWQDNSTDINLPVLSVNGDKKMQTQFTMITSKDSGSITVSPALMFSLNAAQNPSLSQLRGVTTGVGLEDLKLDATNLSYGSPLQIWAVQGSWVKNCWIYNVAGYSLYAYMSLQNEFRHNWIDTNRVIGPNRAGIKLDACSSLQIVDNIITHCFPGVEINGFPGQGGSMGNVIAYNFVTDCPSSSSDIMGMSFASNHGGHTQYDLYEGNIAEKFTSDGYYGSTHGMTLARNWFHGIDPDPARTQDVQCIALKRFARNYNIVGNVLGKVGTNFTYKTTTGGNYPTHYIYQFNYPRSSNFTYSGSAQLSKGIPWADYGKAIGTNGFGELDLDVEASTLVKGNYNTQDRKIPTVESLGSETVPNSYFLSGKPAWFGILPWPAIDPTTPNMSFDAIPAGYRYLNGIDPTPPQAPGNVKIMISAE